jgi:hypothetical protein
MGGGRSMVANGQGGPFDLIDGLPVHPLVVHGAVVLIPLAALGVLLMAAWPRFSRRHGWLVLAVAVVAPGAAVVSVRSGEALAERVGDPGFDHDELGEQLPLVAGALLLATLVLWLLDRWRGRRQEPGDDDPPPRGGLLRALVAVLAVLVALGNLAWVYRVGHSGAQSVWLDEVDGQVQGEGEVSGEAEVPAATFTAAEVAQRAGRSSATSSTTSPSGSSATRAGRRRSRRCAVAMARCCSPPSTRARRSPPRSSPSTRSAGWAEPSRQSDEPVRGDQPWAASRCAWCTCASGPGKTSDSWPSSDQRTRNGGVPSLPCTSRISPSRTGSPTWVLATVMRSPGAAFMGTS